MGLITETNAQYYTGSELFFPGANAVTNLTCTLDTELNDAITSAANYDIYLSISGGTAPVDFVLLDLQTTGALGGATVFTINNPTVYDNGGAGIGPTYVQATGGTGTGAAIYMTVAVGGAITYTVASGGSGYLATDILTFTPGVAWPGSPVAGFDTIALVAADLYTGITYSVSTTGSNAITFFGSGIAQPVPPIASIVVKIQLTQEAIWNNYGSYEYIKLSDVINNFLIAYVGEGKIIPRAKRTDVIFHAKRGLQEFSYDTLKSVKSQELTLSPSATAIIPQDYVNYVRMSWVDTGGVKHIIYPTQLTSNPDQPLIQGADGIPTQDSFGENIESAQALTDERWAANSAGSLSGATGAQAYDASIYNWTWWEAAYGRRYGQDQEVSNMNGWFTINDREGKFMFSSNIKDQLIILEYISDGLAYNLDSKFPKMAEQAIYMHIAHAIVSTTANMPEYVVNRYKKERFSALRNAKIRLQNIKLDTFIQSMRGKSKWLKH